MVHEWEARARLLEAENDELRARVSDLEREIGLAAEPPPMFGLTGSEATIFGILLNNKVPRISAFMAALYSNEADDPPDEAIIKVLVCKMRKQLEPFGIEIKTHRGEGFEMPDASKERARGLMENGVN
jgi:DNA-binding response OmpR family regulator